MHSSALQAKSRGHYSLLALDKLRCCNEAPEHHRTIQSGLLRQSRSDCCRRLCARILSDDRSVDDVGAGRFSVPGLAFVEGSAVCAHHSCWAIDALDLHSRHFWKRFINLAAAQLRWDERQRASTGWFAALYRFLQPFQVNYTALLSVVFLGFVVFVAIPLVIIVRQCEP